MNSAAVGFQCPSCIKEGAKATRTGRLPYGGERSGVPGIVTYVLIGLNVIVWALIQAQASLATSLAIIPRGTCELGNSGNIYTDVHSSGVCNQYGPGAHWVAGVATGAPWQVITSVFAHQEILHIGFNMIALYFIGPQLEAVLGRTRYLALYLISGVTGSAVVMVLSSNNSPTLGASGAIFGLLGALLVVCYKIGADLQPILVWVGINVVFTFVGSNISWQGHLGGFVGGAAVAGILAYAPKKNQAAVQWGGMAGVLILALAVIGLRAAALA
ncbi:MAG TPA: rhomboid family intramembrane serine protease [Marmoricola sp.]|jgi:membrane associated rhomboid family serine protease|nr:rhomboid family intramembrane serine protease [Marmoricola sp.]